MDGRLTEGRGSLSSAAAWRFLDGFVPGRSVVQLAIGTPPSFTMECAATDLAIDERESAHTRPDRCSSTPGPIGGPDGIRTRREVYDPICKTEA